MNKRKCVVITGVSSGIGYATTKVLIDNGFHVFGSIRKKEDADRLLLDFQEHFTPLFFDVTDEEAILAAAKQVSEWLNGDTLFGLINNAGIGFSCPLLLAKPSVFRHILDVNLVGPLCVTQAFISLLKANKESKTSAGRIINISSMGGKIGVPFVGLYSAAKHGLEGFSDCLRRELMLYGIDVVVVAPGAIDTPIRFKGKPFEVDAKQSDFASAFSRFEQFSEKTWGGALPSEEVGKVILKALTTQHPKARYVILRHFWDWLPFRILPKRLADKISAKLLGFK